LKRFRVSMIQSCISLSKVNLGFDPSTKGIGSVMRKRPCHIDEKIIEQTKIVFGDLTDCLLTNAP
jgi:hypothetical protein